MDEELTEVGADPERGVEVHFDIDVDGDVDGYGLEEIALDILQGVKDILTVLRELNSHLGG